MSIIELSIIGIGLSMDAFAVSICQGLTITKNRNYKALIIAIFFGLFQAMMPFVGYVVGLSFSDKVTSVDHWIAFVLLSMIGFNMIKEGLFDKEEEQVDERLYFGDLLLLSIATSIDALAIGVTFAFLEVQIFVAIGVIGTITFFLCFIGVCLGTVFGYKLKGRAELFGGSVLILMALKIIAEHVLF